MIWALLNMHFLPSLKKISKLKIELIYLKLSLEHFTSTRIWNIVEFLPMFVSFQGINTLISQKKNLHLYINFFDVFLFQDYNNLLLIKNGMIQNQNYSNVVLHCELLMGENLIFQFTR